jgi:hypothetical protein
MRYLILTQFVLKLTPSRNHHLVEQQPSSLPEMPYVNQEPVLSFRFYFEVPERQALYLSLQK